MRALSGAVVVLAGAVCISAEVQTVNLHPARWGMMVGLPLVVIGLVGWLATLATQDTSHQQRE